jgi:hypothetical protein
MDGAASGRARLVALDTILRGGRYGQPCGDSPAGGSRKPVPPLP